MRIEIVLKSGTVVQADVTRFEIVGTALTRNLQWENDPDGAYALAFVDLAEVAAITQVARDA